jgi:hypothetical protein
MTSIAVTAQVLMLVLTLLIFAWVPSRVLNLYCTLKVDVFVLVTVANARVGLSSPRRLPHAASLARRVE